MRTLDEEIAHQREVAEKIRTEHNCECDYYDIDIDCVKCAEEHEQLAEWLEELKAIKSDGFTDDLLNMGFTKGYNKAIDDFKDVWDSRVKDLINWCKDRRLSGLEQADLIFDEIAEQLKAGVSE